MRVEPACPVRRPHQRAGQHAGEAERLGELLVLDELLGPDPALDRVMPHRGPQVLRDRDDVAARVVKVGQRGADLLGRLSHTEDEVGLGDQAVGARRGQHRKTALITEPRTDSLEDAGHRFDVVRQHFWARLEDLRQQCRVGVEIRDQQLHPGVRVEVLDRADGLGVQPRTTVGQVVAGHPGDRRIAQPHRLHAFGDAARLVAVEFGGLTCVDLTEVAAAGALFAADEEGGLAVLPAFEDVRAARLLADGVQPFAPDQGLEFRVLRAHLGPGLDPRRLTLDRRLGITHLETQELSAFRSRGRRHRPRGDCHCVNATDRRPSSASATASVTGAMTSSTPTGRPSSAVSDVTPASEMPHGTIAENADRSQSQFSANP